MINIKNIFLSLIPVLGLIGCSGNGALQEEDSERVVVTTFGGSAGGYQVSQINFFNALTNPGTAQDYFWTASGVTTAMQDNIALGAYSAVFPVTAGTYTYTSRNNVGGATNITQNNVLLSNNRYLGCCFNNALTAAGGTVTTAGQISFYEWDSGAALSAANAASAVVRVIFAAPKRALETVANGGPCAAFGDGTKVALGLTLVGAGYVAGTDRFTSPATTFGLGEATGFVVKAAGDYFCTIGTNAAPQTPLDNAGANAIARSETTAGGPFITLAAGKVYTVVINDSSQAALATATRERYTVINHTDSTSAHVIAD